MPSDTAPQSTDDRLRRLMDNWRAESENWERARPGEDGCAGYINQETARTLRECADRLASVLAGGEDVRDD